MKETWKPVVGFDKYEVSNKGRIRSFQRGKEGFIMSQSDDKDGYQKVTLTRGGKEYTRGVHTLVSQSFIPNPDNLPVTNHLNGIKWDNNVSNLEWSTVRDNTIHGYIMGLNNNKGANHHYAKRYQVTKDGKVVGNFTNMHELEKSLKTDRGTIGKYMKEEIPLYEELLIEEVEDFHNDFEVNNKIVINDIQGVLNPISLEDGVNIWYYSSLSKCERLNGLSRAGLRDRLSDGNIYKGKYYIKRVSQYFLLTTENIKINQVIG